MTENIPLFAFVADDELFWADLGITVPGAYFDVASLPWVVEKRKEKPHWDVWHFLRNVRESFQADELTEHIVTMKTAALKGHFDSFFLEDEMPDGMPGRGFKFRRAKSVTVISIPALMIQMCGSPIALSQLSMQDVCNVLEAVPNAVTDMADAVAVDDDNDVCSYSHISSASLTDPF